jgi:hypothetical protein
MTGRGERGIWQQRYWEHTIRDDRDFAAHMDYTHFNPVKHGLVAHPADWPHSSFHPTPSLQWGRPVIAASVQLAASEKNGAPSDSMINYAVRNGIPLLIR